MTTPEEIADGIYRLGTDWVNWYLCRADDELTLVDCGFRGYYDQLPAALEALGLPKSAVRAVVLTHNHPDHVGFAARVSAETGAKVLAPEGDLEGVRTGKVPVPPGMAKNVWRPALMRYLAHVAANSGTTVKAVELARAFGDGDLLETAIPLRVVHTPGHTSGHCSLVAEDRGVLFAGDALATVDFFKGDDQVTLLPFNQDRERARESLERVGALEAEVVAAGHGKVLRTSPSRAASEALAVS